MKHLLVGVFMSVVCCLDLPKLPRLMPTDEAAQDPALMTVRQQVLAAAKNRNARSLMFYVSSRVMLEGVMAEGDANWRALDRVLADKDDSNWTEIPRALNLGGAFTTTRGAVLGRREFCAPYPYAALPERVPDAVLGERPPWVITEKDVEVHSSPDLRSAVLGRLSYSMVQANGAERRDARDASVVWQTINLPDEKEGFVVASTIWFPGGYHVCFARDGGQWTISAIARSSQP
jgi:hypothetical protein